MDEEIALQAENTQILYRLESLLTKTSLSGLILSSNEVGLLPHYQVLIYKTYVLLRLRQFWNKFQTEFASKVPYKVNIDGIWLRLTKL